MPTDMPAVAVQDGTTPTQRVVQAPLDSLAAQVAGAGLRSPTLIIIGNVVSLLEERGGAPADVVFEGADVSSGAERTAELTADEVLDILATVKAA